MSKIYQMRQERKNNRGRIIEDIKKRSEIV